MITSIGPQQLSELKSRGFILLRGAFSDLLPGIREQSAEYLNKVRQAAEMLLQRAHNKANQSSVMQQTGAPAQVQLSSAGFGSPLGEYIFDGSSGAGITDIRLLGPNFGAERGTPLGALIERVETILQPFNVTNRVDLQLRHVPAEDGIAPPRKQLYAEVDYHNDGGGVFRRTSDLGQLPGFRFLTGAYLTDMDADYHDRAAGQLILVDGGVEFVAKQYAELIPLLENEQDAAERWKLYDRLIKKAVRDFANGDSKRLVTVRARPGDLLIAHALTPHGSGRVFVADPANNPPGRTAIYMRCGRFDKVDMGSRALTDPNFIWQPPRRPNNGS